MEDSKMQSSLYEQHNATSFAFFSTLVQDWSTAMLLSVG